VLLKVWAETISHSKRKLLLGLVISMLALATQYIIRLRSMSDTKKIVLSFVVAIVIVMIGSFVWNLIKIPALLYPEPRKRSAADEANYAIARVAFEKLGPNAVSLLRQIKQHGFFKFGLVPPPLPNGMNERDTRTLLTQCVTEHLLTVQSTLASGMPDISYIIAPGMASVIDDLLYLPAISPQECEK
jgi:hypothetical protein